MAKQQGGTQSRGSSRGGDSSAGRSTSGRSASSGASSGSAARTGGSTAKQTGSSGSSGGRQATADQRSDQERELNVSREKSNTSPTEMGTAGTPGSSTMAASRTGAPRTDTPTVTSTQSRSQPSTVSSGPSAESSFLPTLMSNPWLMTNAFLSNPFGLARAMNQEMDRLFSGGPADVSPYSQRAGSGVTDSQSVDVSRGQRSGIGRWSPQVEVRQNGNQLTVCADLPGLTAKDIDIQIDDGVLTISGERQQSTEDKRDGYYRSERSYGSFSRSIALPDGVNEDQIRAKFDNGVLEVTVPVPDQRQRGRRVEIQSGG
jgi:HSP20 family protein